MQVRLLKDCAGPSGPLPAGTLIEGPDAYRHVQLGVAEPTDEEAIAFVEKWRAMRHVKRQRGPVVVPVVAEAKPTPAPVQPAAAVPPDEDVQPKRKAAR